MEKAEEEGKVGLGGKLEFYKTYSRTSSKYLKLFHEESVWECLKKKFKKIKFNDDNDKINND